MTALEDRFQAYSDHTLNKQELDDAVFNFLGFVKTVMLIANDNEEKRKQNESGNSNTSKLKDSGRRQITRCSKRKLAEVLPKK